MSIVPLREKNGGFLAIEKFFPVYRAEEACIVYVERGKAITEPWNVTKVADLPFVHRMELFETNKGAYLIASTLCGRKRFQDDWSTPGTVFAASLLEDPLDDWILKPILEGIFKNHGMHVTKLNGHRVILICGREGLFMLGMSRKTAPAWSNERLINHEVSDVFVIDIDNDGREEIITIEPFHGDVLAVYGFRQGQWRPVFRRPIDFGHALWAGKILGRTCIIVGSRRGNKELTLLSPEGNDTFKMHSTVIDENVGPVSLAIVHKQGCELVFSANHGSGEAVLYEITA